MSSNVPHSSAWENLAKNYTWVKNAEIANSLLCTLALSDTEGEMSTTEIAEKISKETKGQIYKLSATLKSSLESLKNLGLVEGRNIPDAKKSMYKITPKGKTLLKGWIAFLDALD